MHIGVQVSIPWDRYMSLRTGPKGKAALTVALTVAGTPKLNLTGAWPPQSRARGGTKRVGYIMRTKDTTWGHEATANQSALMEHGHGSKAIASFSD